MSLIYPHEERIAARSLIKRTDEFLVALEEIGKGERPFSPELAGVLTTLTKTSDMEGQHRALGNLVSRLREHHEKRLIEVAPSDLSAFAEVINPHEPPARHHVFLTDKLNEIAVTPNAKLMVSMPPGHAKDLWVDTPVMMGDGSWKRLGDVEIGDFVITHEGRAREVLAVHDQGKRPILTICTKTGRVIRAHPEHPFLTPSGWVIAKELKRGSTLALVRDFSIGDSSGRSLDEFALAGYLMASGIVRGRAYSRMRTITAKFRTDDPAIMQDVVEITKRMGFGPVLSRGLCYGEKVSTATFNEVAMVWLKRNKLNRMSRRTMRVPEWVFKGDLTRIAAFVGAIVACDASLVPMLHKQSGRARVLQIMLRNAGLVTDLQRLLMRIGARSGLAALLYENYNYSPTEFFRLSIPDAEDQTYLSRRLRIRGTSRRFWDRPPPVTHFFDGRYAEDQIISVTEADDLETRCLTIDEDSSFLADGLVVHNSTYCSHLFPAWYVGRFPARKYLQAGHTQKFCEKQFCGKVETIINSVNYHKVFPDVSLTTESASEFATTNGCEYVTRGVGQGISGYRSHCNGVDDPFKSYRDAQSPTVREYTWDWFANDFMTRLLPGGIAFMIATRWHTADIAGIIEEKMQEGLIEPWEIINLAVYSPGELLDPLRRTCGEPLWPDFFDRKFLENQRNTMSDIQWSCLYLGSPILEKGNILQRDWVQYYRHAPIILAHNQDPRPVDEDPANWPKDPGNLPEDPENHVGNQQNSWQNFRIPPENNKNKAQFSKPVFCLRTIVSVDSAETVTQRADNSAIQVWRLGSDHRHYLCEVVADRFEFPALIEMVELMARRWSADGILMEEKGAGLQYIQSRKGKAPCAIFGFKPGQVEKTFRFEGTMMDWRSGRVLVPESAPWLPAYLDELLKFPSGKRDDNVDATSQYLKWSATGAAHRRGTVKLRGI